MVGAVIFMVLLAAPLFLGVATVYYIIKVPFAAVGYVADALVGDPEGQGGEQDV